MYDLDRFDFAVVGGKQWIMTRDPVTCSRCGKGRAIGDLVILQQDNPLVRKATVQCPAEWICNLKPAMAESTQ